MEKVVVMFTDHKDREIAALRHRLADLELRLTQLQRRLDDADLMMLYGTAAPPVPSSAFSGHAVYESEELSGTSILPCSARYF